MTKEKVIVTGGAGFIGSHIVDALVEEGYDVHVIDDLSEGKREYVNKEAVLHEADIRNLDTIRPFFQNALYVFHEAARPRVQASIEDPKTTHEVNVDGTLNVLIAAKDAGVKRVIYAASSSAYGDQEQYPLREEMSARPMSPYGLHKYIGEEMCRVFSLVYGIETVSLRYFNVYGSRYNPEGAYALVIGKFIEQKKRGEALTIVPPGTQTRDFTHVRDVVRANVLAVKAELVGKGEVINIGNGDDRSVLDVAKLVGGPTVMIESRLEPQKTRASNAKAKKLLDWSPTVSLEEGIAELKREAGIE